MEQPNLRIQDGPTREWLCEACEQRFSSWEKPFAEHVFQYVQTTSADQQPVAYREWALKFAVSISWQTLLFCRERGFDHLSADDLACVSRAFDAWRNFLLGRAPHPGEFEQHVVLVDTLEEVSGPPVSPFLNRYFLETVHTDLITSKPMCITYSKLFRVVIIGFLRMKANQHWGGTKLHLRSGKIGGSHRLPPLLANYWNDKANQVAAAVASMSDRQAEKVNAVFANADPNQLVNSEAFRAMRADVEFSGDQAFKSTGRGSKDAG